MTRKPNKKKSAPRPRRKASPKTKLDRLDDFITAAAGALDIKIGRSWMPTVRTHLRVTLAHGARIADFTLPDDAEPAPVFEL
jgi:hypothetical protein